MTLIEALGWPNSMKVFLVEVSIQKSIRGVSSVETFFWTGSLAPPDTPGTMLNRWMRRAKSFNGNPYLPIVSGVPKVSIRTQPRFDEVGLRGTGQLECLNLDGYFDDLQDYDWDAGTITLRMGCDVPRGGVWDKMVYSDYEVVGVWRIGSWKAGTTEMKFELIPQSRRLDGVQVSGEYFERSEFPSILASHEGRPKPIGYGQLFGVEATCVNTINRRFRVLGHSCWKFGKITSNGVEVFPIEIIKGTCAFRLSTEDWTGSEEVRVDLYGKPLADDSGPIDNPADVVEDLLNTYGGESVDFSTQRAEWKIGEDRSGRERHEYEIAMLLDEGDDKLSSLIEQIGAVSGGVFFENMNGDFTFQRYTPIPSEEAVLTIHEGEILDPDIRIETDALAVHTKATGLYANNQIVGTQQIATASADSAKTRRQLPAHSIRSANLPLAISRCADMWVSRVVGMEKLPIRTWDIKVSHIAFLLEPGQGVIIKGERFADEIFLEVLEVHRDLITAEVRLILSNWRGLNDGPGFWVGDSPVFPARLGGGSCAAWDSNWTDAQAKWARENVGFWTDDNSYADPSDNRSWLGSTWS